MVQNTEKQNESMGVYKTAAEMQRTKWEEMRILLWNPTEKAFLGRNATSWARVTIFYILYYTLMFGFWALNMFVLMRYVINYEVPYYTLDESRIGSNPGMAFKPVPIQEDIDVYITYNSADANGTHEWTSKLDDFLNDYRKDNAKHQECDFDNPPAAGNTCKVKLDVFGPCVTEKQYGWNANFTPCIFIKVNKIFGWVPEPYDDMTKLPADMPQDLADHIKESSVQERNKVWMSCHNKPPHPETTVFKYYPDRGVPTYFYPFMNIPGYVSPFLAIEIQNLTLNERVTIECRTWAKNVFYNGHRNDRQGSIIFDLLVS